jgi:type II secretory pathway pseudopilin PulG
VLKLVKRQEGITLLEVILVLTIASALLVLSTRIYRLHQQQLQITRLQYNLDAMFNALSQYYYANCSNSSAAGGLNPGGGNLWSSTGSGVNLSQPQLMGLYTASYGLKDYLKLTNLANNDSIVDNSGDTNAVQYSGYVLQFNPKITTNAETIGACTTTPGCGTPVETAHVTNTSTVLFSMQVAIKVFMPSSFSSAQKLAYVTAYQNALGADCSSVLVSGVVTPCASATASSTNNYLVFTRMPSFSSSTAASRLWQSLPYLKQFNVQFTHDQMYELTYGSFGTPIYYVCGG